jgi:hypothetical protein
MNVTLRSREEHTIDLACTQYGHFDSLTPWDEFEEKRILDILECKITYSLSRANMVLTP